MDQFEPDAPSHKAPPRYAGSNDGFADRLKWKLTVEGATDLTKGTRQVKKRPNEDPPVQKVASAPPILQSTSNTEAEERVRNKSRYKPPALLALLALHLVVIAVCMAAYMLAPKLTLILGGVVWVWVVWHLTGGFGFCSTGNYSGDGDGE